MRDILPAEMPMWDKIETLIRKTVAQYGYQEIRSPIIEQTALFKRAIGDVTDIVEKEMYTFLDRNGDSLSLRPEATASCVRAAIENGLLYNQTQKLWYYGPMFRHERPQKGRYRQFYQFGVEALGQFDPMVDAEQVILSHRLWQQCGISAQLVLEINSLGTKESRDRYREALVAYFQAHLDQLDEDSVRRLSSNPLRILDSKNPAMQSLIHGAPKLLDYLDEEAQAYFEQFKAHLDEAGIAYKVNPTLVRGLDYYCHIVYEWVTTELGAQGTVCAGGRYDGLVELLGGKPTPAVGFAMGIERLVSLMTLNNTPCERGLEAYLILLGEKAQKKGLHLAERLRDQKPGLSLLMGSGGSSKSQFKKADQSGALLALVIGDDELENDQVTVKFLRDAREQVTLAINDFK
jgi:histidyl-tRNA synthetase